MIFHDFSVFPEANSEPPKQLLTATQQCHHVNVLSLSPRVINIANIFELFCLIPQILSGKSRKKNYLKKGIEFTVRESSILVFFLFIAF